ncbi:EAL domain-containing protein, partial [Pantoea sp.]|uniref:putative bifunctional diguanylate cyclase/phosphodiesterase n=1 Tax=Pantoea sp. TaxID=69393 RepID=UPI00289A8F47
PLLAAARARHQEAVARNMIVDKVPAIVVAAPITPGSVPNLPPVAGPPSVMVFVNLFTPAKLAMLGKDLDVRQPRAPLNAQDAQASPRLTIATANGDPIVIRWLAKKPGMHLIFFLLPLLVITAIVIALVTRRVIRHAMHNAGLSDRRFDMLMSSQSELMESENRFRDVAEAASDWIWETDAQGKISYLSVRFTDVTGYDGKQWLGRHLDHLLSHATHSVVEWLTHYGEEAHRSPLRCHFISAQGERRICRLAAKAVWRSGQLDGFRGTVTDITQEVEAQARIQFLSQHDVLTGLPNRMRLQEFLTGRLVHICPEDPLVMISLDLDQFKPINDTWGHAAGDAALNLISQRLQRCVRNDELVARVGGDEFILIIREPDRAGIERRCAQLLREVQQPIIVGSQSLFVGASMGIACAPQDAAQPDELLCLADIALYKAKQAGRNQWVCYSNEMSNQLEDKRDMARRIERALEHEEFRLYYQPRYQLQSGRLAGAEALIRWQPAPDLWITPDRFIPLAEENGLITLISDWVLMRACGDALSWGDDLYVSVNISPVEFRSLDLVQRVSVALEKTGLPATRLELEITENVTFENPQRALMIMQGLRALGVRLTVDDFGTGYAALGYLKTFPFNGLKIDRSWMKDFPESQQAQSVVAGIIGLARAFTLTVTAEGIETEAQLNQLKRLSCEEGQGYFLGRPVPLTAFSALLDVNDKTQA